MIETVDRLLALRESLTIAELGQGQSWYSDAGAIAEGMARRHRFTTKQAAFTIAALSPSNRWYRNLTDADTLMRAVRGHRRLPRVCTYHTNKRAALRVLRRGDFTAVRGPKVRPFAKAILGDGNALVLDRHALRAAGVNPGASMLVRDFTAQAYRYAAHEVGERACDFQAQVWIAQRGAAT